MSHIDLVIEERVADIGNLKVGRLLPFRKTRSIGPFVLIDHMGPYQLDSGQAIDMPPHPHIGLSTLTYLFDGAIVHRDSTGAVVEIKPGDVNWMTAGRGVVHSERIPDRLRGTNQVIHGIQVWVALPRPMEQMEPSFFHIEAKDVPTWEQDGVAFRLIAGEVAGRKSPVPVQSPLYFLELKCVEKTHLQLAFACYGESGLYIMSGGIRSDDRRFGPKQIVMGIGEHPDLLEIEANSTLFIFGGEPLEEEHFIHWNFVNSDRAVIEKARHDWLVHAFPEVKGDSDFVPLPK